MDTSFARSYTNLLRLLINQPDYICDSRIGEMREIISYSFKCPLKIDWDKFAENFPHWNYAYAKEFFAWMMSGSTNIMELAKYNKNVLNFMPGAEIPANFSTAYGPRIIQQWDGNAAEILKTNSRRVIFFILDKGDNFLRTLDTKMEYPCCSYIQFFKRSNDINNINEIDVIANFRSSNAYITMLYDVYNISMFAEAFIRDVQFYDTTSHYHLNSLSFQLGSAHLFSSNLEHAKILVGC